jgi:hypothetical protein
MRIRIHNLVLNFLSNTVPVPVFSNIRDFGSRFSSFVSFNGYRYRYTDIGRSWQFSIIYPAPEGMGIRYLFFTGTGMLEIVTGLIFYFNKIILCH